MLIRLLETLKKYWAANYTKGDWASDFCTMEMRLKNRGSFC